MATPSEKLASSLEILKQIQDRGIIAIRSADLTRTHRVRLVQAGFLQEVLRGWYIPSRPDETAGESTAWFTSYWRFCAAYLTERFGQDWCLSPGQSLQLHAGNKTVPTQLFVRANQAKNGITHLIFDTSILEVRATIPNRADIVTDENGLRIFSLPAALIYCSKDFYIRSSTDARAALAMVRDASEILPSLLDSGHSTIAARLSGAFRNIGRTRIADDITNGMKTAGYTIQETDPFEAQSSIVLSPREISPYVNRLYLMWQDMRGVVIEIFPEAKGLPVDKKAYLKQVADNYVNDAYNSLSIEGYRVSPELIERVRSGSWEPEKNEQDKQHRDAMAARGYWQAYQAVQKSLERILNNENAGAVADRDHITWYREMFAPSVTAGILRASDLAGYRHHPVYIRRSKHVPPHPDAVRDLMPAFFELLKQEENAAVRVVLGHFVFVYIHPYMDGNGRTGRFLMNMMMASGGYPWTVIPLERHNDYMEALERASTEQDISAFAKFLAELLNKK